MIIKKFSRPEAADTIFSQGKLNLRMDSSVTFPSGSASKRRLNQFVFSWGKFMSTYMEPADWLRGVKCHKFGLRVYLVYSAYKFSGGRHFRQFPSKKVLITLPKSKFSLVKIFVKKHVDFFTTSNLLVFIRHE